jgi:2-dehydro-3-deoxyphosphogluconate aldolase/(4S)-4-hydroxy-2-oxoglutarate aldolase
MTKEQISARIQEIGIMPSIRVNAEDLALFAAETVYAAGISVVEVTMTVPNAIGVITQLARKYPDMVLGAGTVLDLEMSKRCVDAGVRFLTSPGPIPGMTQYAHANGIVSIPGAMTPGEVIAAWKEGAEYVKIFPCAQLGGDRYIRALKTPFPQIPLIASGGVNQLTAANFIFAGAASLGIGSELMPKKALHTRQSQWIHELARRFIETIHNARLHMSGEDED